MEFCRTLRNTNDRLPKDSTISTATEVMIFFFTAFEMIELKRGGLRLLVDVLGQSPSDSFGSFSTGCHRGTAVIFLPKAWKWIRLSQ